MFRKVDLPGQTYWLQAISRHQGDKLSIQALLSSYLKISPMVKRKQPSAPSFPSEVHLQPAIRNSSAVDGTGPFVAYFASGYCPGNNDSLNFELYKNVDRPRERRLLVQKVSPVSSLLPSPQNLSSSACSQQLADSM